MTPGQEVDVDRVRTTRPFDAPVPKNFRYPEMLVFYCTACVGGIDVRYCHKGSVFNITTFTFTMSWFRYIVARGQVIEELCYPVLYNIIA